jgi:hypothetical protein
VVSSRLARVFIRVVFVVYYYFTTRTMNSLIRCSLWILLFCQWVWISHCFIVSPIGSFGRSSYDSKRKVHAVFSSFPRNRGFERSGHVEPQRVEKHQDNSGKEYELMLEQLRNCEDAGFQEILTKLCTDAEFQILVARRKKNDLIEIFRKWNTPERSKEEVCHVLKAASRVLSMHHATEKVLLNELIRSYLTEQEKSCGYVPQFLVLPLRKLGFVKDQKNSPSDLAMFLTILRKIDFQWKSMEADLKQGLLSTLSVVIGSNGIDERSYTEILMGLQGIGMLWTELPKPTSEAVSTIFMKMKDNWNASSSIKAMNTFRKMGMNEMKLDSGDKMNIFLKALAELELRGGTPGYVIHVLLIISLTFSI